MNGMIPSFGGFIGCLVCLFVVGVVCWRGGDEEPLDPWNRNIENCFRAGDLITHTNG